MRAPRIYRYILKHDDGYAPCVDDRLLTLATCKPMIRSTAKEGDWVAGYMPKGLGEGLLVWFGCIDSTMFPTDYEQKFRGRKDAQYRLDDVGKIERVNSQYHPDQDQQRKDLNAKVLIFDPKATWYFGGRPVQPPLPLDFLKPEGQGHRVNLRRQNDLAEMVAWLKTAGQPGIFGQPRSFVGEDCESTCAPKSRKVSKGC